MRNLHKYILASVALAASALSFSTIAIAQSTASVQYDKQISGPNDDGVYTINLEAYVTGKVTVENATKPADIVLVLDYSSSMTNNSLNGVTRINVLRKNVAKFVNTVKTSNASIEEQFKDDPDGDGKKDGHRIAFVLYSGGRTTNGNGVYIPGGQVGRSGNGYTVPTGISLNTFLNAEKLEATEQTNSGIVTYEDDTNENGLLSPNTSGGTYSGDAMAMANTILSQQTYAKDTDGNDKRSRVVVFFTDGEPGYGDWSWTSSTSMRKIQADKCILNANTIRNAEAYSATVYAIGLFDLTNPQTTKNEVTTFMKYSSSDKNGVTTMPTSGWETVGPTYSAIVSNEQALANVFDNIATSASDTYSAASASSVLVDIVSTNFNLPTGSDASKIKAYRVACTQNNPDAILPTFSTTKEPITLYELDKDGNIVYEEDGVTPKPGLVVDGDKVTATGFDYGANWCGYDETLENEDGTKGGPHGYKLVLEVPITVKDDIVGGPAVETNDPGSELIIRDSDGTVLQRFPFIPPVVKIPVTIWIKKEGLLSYTAEGVQGHEDNAVFTIRKIKYIGHYETDEDGERLEGGKQINYYYKKGEWDDNTGPSFTVNGESTTVKWKTFTKVTVNMKEGLKDGIVKISGLDPDYVYRIEEDAWAHLGYNFDPDDTARYTIEWDETEGKYVDVENPFIFSNTPKTKAFYAEDVYRNVFGQGTGTGQGIVTTNSSSGDDSGSDNK